MSVMFACSEIVQTAEQYTEGGTETPPTKSVKVLHFHLNYIILEFKLFTGS